MHSSWRFSGLTVLLTNAQCIAKRRLSCSSNSETSGTCSSSNVSRLSPTYSVPYASASHP
eukprot:scaffold207_cov409-Prasinococcus_capsulatus_cf.AAC.62